MNRFIALQSILLVFTAVKIPKIAGASWSQTPPGDDAEKQRRRFLFRRLVWRVCVCGTEASLGTSGGGRKTFLIAPVSGNFLTSSREDLAWISAVNNPSLVFIWESDGHFYFW